MFYILFYKKLLTANWYWIKKVLWWALVWLVLGIVTPLVFSHFADEFFRLISDTFKKVLGQDQVTYTFSTVTAIFIQNLRSALVGLFLGVVLAILPYLIISFNAYTIGIFLTMIVRKNIWSVGIFLLALIPHGIFEIPALIISAAFGARLGLFWKIKEPSLTNKQKFLLALKQNAQLVPLIVLLLMIAASTEVFVSSRVVDLFTPRSAITEQVVTSTPEVHIHADFKVIINNKAINFSLPKYQSSEDKPHDAFAHLHDGNGDVLHIHKDGITLGYFFKTLGMEFTKNCFKLDTGQKYCSTARYPIELFVNGQKQPLLSEYIPQDLDRILITFGTTAKPKIEQQITSVSDKACIYSKTCPERGDPPTESCVKALGVPCK
jgi:stage II sporulation protein M